jgi:hypothetical protein
MKITICGSIAFHDEMTKVMNELLAMGHEVKIPPFEIMGDDGKMMPIKDYYNLRKATTTDHSWVWDRKAEAITAHYDKVAWSDVILVLNYDKNGIVGYVGGNTLMEMGVAFFLKKNIFMYNPIPEISYKEEILGMKPILIGGDLKMIK